MSVAPSPFFQTFNATEAGQFIGLASNSIQIGTFIYSVAAGLLEQSETDEVLDAIGQLQQLVADDFIDLGEAMERQIAAVITDIDTDFMAEALAHSATAADKISRYYREQDAADLDDAATESDLGIQFFLSLPATSTGDPPTASRTDPLFLPGIIKAAVIRVLALVTQDGNVASIPDDVQQIQDIIDLAQGMIDTVTANVNAAHTVAPKVFQPGKLGIEPIYEGWEHLEFREVLQIFGAPGSHDLETPELKAAEAEADAARLQGIRDELAALGVTAFQALINQWSEMITHRRWGPIIPIGPGWGVFLP